MALCPDTRLLWNIKVWRLGARRFDKKVVAVTVGFETPFLLVVDVREWGERKGGTRKEGRQGGAVSSARLSRVWPTRLREEGGRFQLSCRVRELLIPAEIATMVMLASYSI